MPALNAPMLTAEAMVGAAAALSSTRICRGGTVANPNAPSRNSVAAAGTWAVAVTVNTASTIASPPSST